MSKLWQKETETERSVEKFTVGNDRELDHQLAAFDVLGSLAHTRMLESIGLMDSQDLEQVQAGLKAQWPFAEPPQTLLLYREYI